MQFHLELTIAEKDYLRELVRLSIARHFDRSVRVPQPVSDAMQQHFGAFVTLKQHGQLRGCIGHIVGDRPLHQTITQMARAAAFNDPRFPPLTQRELPELDVEISILGPLRPCSPDEVQPGRHGLLIRSGHHSGLLLPQVAVEHGWDRETFLSQTCRKAGLPAGAWKEEQVELYCFEAEIF